MVVLFNETLSRLDAAGQLKTVHDLKKDGFRHMAGIATTNKHGELILTFPDNPFRADLAENAPCFVLFDASSPEDRAGRPPQRPLK